MKKRKAKKQYSYYLKIMVEGEPRHAEFKRKADAEKYIKHLGLHSLTYFNSKGKHVKGCILQKEVTSICGWYTERVWTVNVSSKWVPEFKQCNFWDGKRINKGLIMKSDVRFFIKSEHINKLMIYIAKLYDKGLEPSDSNLKNLIDLFKFRFGRIPDDTDGYGESITKLSECEFYYWSDRCHFNRASKIVECVRNERPHLLA